MALSKDIQIMRNDVEEIKTNVALIKQDLAYVKERLSKVETAVYSVGGVIILAVLGVIINFFVRSPIK